MTGNESGRLTRMEDKLDTLSEAISKLAVVDARLTDFIAANSRTSARLSDVEILLSAQAVQINSLTRISNTLSGCIITAFCGAVLKIVGVI